MSLSDNPELRKRARSWRAREAYSSTSIAGGDTIQLHANCRTVLDWRAPTTPGPIADAIA